MCDTGTNYLCNLQVCLGKQGSVAEQQQGARVVRDLVGYIYGTGRNVNTDDFFPSYELAQFLLSKSLTTVETMRKNRKKLPSEILRQGKQFESAFFFVKDTALVSYAPKRNKSVILLSTMNDHVEVDDTTEARKPYIILDYNLMKGAVDTFDEQISAYSSMRSMRGKHRWPMRLTFFLVDAACLSLECIYVVEYEESHMARSCRFQAALQMLLVSSGSWRCTSYFSHCRRASTQQTSHMPSVARAMLAIGV